MGGIEEASKQCNFFCRKKHGMSESMEWKLKHSKALCTRERICTAPFFFGSDPEFLMRAHGIGARIICVHTGADPSSSN